MENNGLPSIETQREEARQWAQLLRDAGYEIVFMYTGEPEPFDREWQVWTKGGDRIGTVDLDADNGTRIASIDIDGCGASWHGPDELWLQVIGSKVGVTS